MHPSCDSRQRRAHRERRRQETNARDEPPEEITGDTVATPRGVHIADERQDEKQQQTDDTDGDLEQRVHLQRMMPP